MLPSPRQSRSSNALPVSGGRGLPHGEAPFCAIFEHASDAIIVTDTSGDGRVLTANPAACALFGYAPEEFVGVSRAELIDADPDLTALLDARGRSGRAEAELTYRRKDGTRFTGALTSAFIDEHHAVAIIRDVSERKRNEHLVRELNASLERHVAELDAERLRWRSVVESIAEEVWLCDAEGRMSLLNLPDTTAMGLDEFERKTVHEVLEEVEILFPNGQVRPPEEAPLLRSLRNGETVRGEEIMRHRRTGRVRYRQFSGAPTRDANGVITGAVAIVRDVTENKQIEQALREADRRKDEFLAMLSHELRNPLAPIKNSLYILERTAPDGEQAQRARATIERQVQHLTRLVGDLLDVSRITRGKIQLQRERLDLSEVLARTLEDHRSLFAAGRIELGVEQPTTPVWVNGDATRLAQALGNILQNAVKFTPPGGRVSVELALDRGKARVTVRDTGIGIPADMMDLVFEPFTQADRSLDRGSGGLGLGLALVKGLITLHGGEVHASSPGPGLGAELVVLLPADTEAVPPPRVELTATRPKGRRVLVIEDNVDAAESLKEALELGDHHVVVAFTGPEGLDKARVFAPEVVLCDIGLPGMDGYEVARTFRADATLSRIALVALTGYAGPEDQARAARAGFDRHMAKPPDMIAIERLLAELPEQQAG